jgi:maltooligosyltrehalose trehalohydrolase
MIFQGEEFASSSSFLYFADHEDPDLARAVSEGRRREHAPDGAWDSVPDPESEDTFNQSKLKWEERAIGKHKAMLEWYRSLIELRASNPCLQEGSLLNVQVAYDEDAKWLAMQRGPTRLLWNFGSVPVSFPVGENSELCLCSDTCDLQENGSIVLPAESFAAVTGPKGS